MKTKTAVVLWDWKASPDTKDVNDAIRSVGGKALFYEAETGGDTMGWVVSNRQLTENEVQTAFDSEFEAVAS